MQLLDWIVIALFVGVMIWIVVTVLRKKNENSSDYFLGGRDATWIAIGTSLFASNIGSEHLIGLAGAGASSGMAMAHWEIQGWMILLLGWVFVPFYSRSMVLTMPEFLERRYNSQSRTILSMISLISYVMTKVAVTVYAAVWSSSRCSAFKSCGASTSFGLRQSDWCSSRRFTPSSAVWNPS